ncbi:MAG: PAS domain S-box protein, partial [Gemmatimonadota bacterium]
MAIAQKDLPPAGRAWRPSSRAAAEMADATVVVVDADGTVASVNPDFERTAGYSRYEILGKSIAELEEGDRDPLFFRLIEEAVRRREAASEVCHRRRREGPAGRETATVHPMCDALGRVTGCVAIKHPP